MQHLRRCHLPSEPSPVWSRWRHRWHCQRESKSIAWQKRQDTRRITGKERRRLVSYRSSQAGNLTFMEGEAATCPLPRGPRHEVFLKFSSTLLCGAHEQGLEISIGLWKPRPTWGPSTPFGFASLRSG